MRTRNVFAVALAGLLVIGNVHTVVAGGRLEQIDITGNVPSPIAGHLVARVVGIQWDARSLPVRYSMNTTLDPIPNPLGASVLTLAQAQAALQVSLNQWNSIRTSYIDMHITGSTANVALRGFDFVNELTFRTAAGFTAIASSPSTSLIADATFADGDDIDGDGDSDVSSMISITTDVDGDGDFEFPAGFYKAGTILDNDVQFNTKVSNGFRFTVGDAAIDADPFSVDLNTVATHEFGHSFGLSHTLINQISGVDGSSSTMFPFIDTDDPTSELEQRSLSADDIAWASYLYPEGTAASGPAALQAGDIPFSLVYGTIQGSIQHGVFDEPIAGAHVYATNQSSRQVVSSAFSGTTQFSFDPATGGLFLVDPAFNILDGNYTIPVPLGAYAVAVEPVDGAPAAAANISLTCQVGAIFGQMNFNEEFYNRTREGAVETRPGETFPVIVLPGTNRTGISIVTDDTFNISNFGNRNFVGFTALVPGRYYAVAVPVSQIAAIAPGEPIAVPSMLFDTTVLDSSVAPVFAEVMLTTGTVSGTTATINLTTPIDKAANFVAQDNDFAPFFLRDPVRLGQRLREAIALKKVDTLFLVLRVPTTTPFPGVSGLPPLIGLDGGVATNDAPIFGLSFTSVDGGATFTQVPNFNFRFSLVVSRLPTP